MPVSNRAINRGIYICSNCGESTDLEDADLKMYVGEGFDNTIEFDCIVCGEILSQNSCFFDKNVRESLSVVLNTIQNVNTDEEVEEMEYELGYLADIFGINV